MLFNKIRFFSGYRIRCTYRQQYHFLSSYIITVTIATKNDDCKNKREQLCSFENWPQWTDLTQAILKKKEIWDMVDRSYMEPIITIQTQKKVKGNTVTFKLIKQGVNSDLYINIIREMNPQRSQKTLHQVCFQVGQGIINSIFKELLNYPRIAKPLGYEKKSTTISIATLISNHRVKNNIGEHHINSCS